MKKVYISSTYKDLIEYRKAVSDALRKINYKVVGMEDYVARNKRTVAACEDDVVECDIYIGIFAWRYGHIPPEDDNKEKKSITEIEYRKASEDKTCLIFLLADEAPWPSTLRDAETGEGDRGERIRQLRTDLKNYCAGYFSTPYELATEVITAVHQHESTIRVQRMDVIKEIKESQALGPSFLSNIRNKIVKFQDAKIIEINIGPTPWWTTRLHLVAALTSDFTRIRQFVFLDDKGGFILMASPGEVRRALTRLSPQLEQAYLGSLNDVSQGKTTSINDIEHVVMNYPIQIFKLINKEEQEVKQDISTVMLHRDLGIEPSADSFERNSVSRPLLQWEILRRSTPFVVLLEESRLVSVIDRVQMASEIAIQALAERIN